MFASVCKGYLARPLVAAPELRVSILATLDWFASFNLPRDEEKPTEENIIAFIFSTCNGTSRAVNRDRRRELPRLADNCSTTDHEGGSFTAPRVLQNAAHDVVLGQLMTMYLV